MQGSVVVSSVPTKTKTKSMPLVRAINHFYHWSQFTDLCYLSTKAFKIVTPADGFMTKLNHTSLPLYSFQTEPLAHTWLSWTGINEKKNTKENMNVHLVLTIMGWRESEQSRERQKHRVHKSSSTTILTRNNGLCSKKGYWLHFKKINKFFLKMFTDHVNSIPSHCNLKPFKKIRVPHRNW